MKRFAIAAALWGAACAKPDDEARPEGGGSAVTAAVESVGTATFDETVDAVGTVTARPGHVAVLAAPAPTRVAKVFVSPGAVVKPGDPLIEFEQAPFEAAARSAEAALAAAERADARAARLAEAGVLPRKEADAAATELATARATVVTARRARELALLRAPIAGVVTRMTASLGASVDPSVPVVEVTDSRALDVTVAVSPAAAPRTRPGQPVEFRATAGDSAAIARGRVAEVAAVVDSATGAVQVRVTIVPPVGPIRVGQTLFGRIAVARHPSAVVVPLDALVPTGEGFRVFTIDTAGVAHAAAVQVGGRTDRVAWITDGVKAGDRIVTRGAYGVDDGSKVVPSQP